MIWFPMQADWAGGVQQRAKREQICMMVYIYNKEHYGVLGKTFKKKKKKNLNWKICVDSFFVYA